MTTPSQKPEKKHVGRPTTYSLELAELICERVATTTLGLQKLCDTYSDLPAKSTVNLWRYKHSEFSTQYAQAKLFQADLLAEECLDIADNSQNDWMESLVDDEQSLGWKINGDHINRCRLRIDTRKFLAAKLLPKQYGKSAEDIDTSGLSASVVEKLIDKLVE
jgi:hypothetical protein